MYDELYVFFCFSEFFTQMAMCSILIGLSFFMKGLGGIYTKPPVVGP